MKCPECIKDKNLNKGKFWCWHCYHWVDYDIYIEECMKCHKQRIINYY